MSDTDSSISLGDMPENLPTPEESEDARRERLSAAWPREPSQMADIVPGRFATDFIDSLIQRPRPLIGSDWVVHATPAELLELKQWRREIAALHVLKSIYGASFPTREPVQCNHLYPRSNMVEDQTIYQLEVEEARLFMDAHVEHSLCMRYFAVHRVSIWALGTADADAALDAATFAGRADWSVMSAVVGARLQGWDPMLQPLRREGAEEEEEESEESSGSSEEESDDSDDTPA